MSRRFKFILALIAALLLWALLAPHLAAYLMVSRPLAQCRRDYRPERLGSIQGADTKCGGTVQARPFRTHPHHQRRRVFRLVASRENKPAILRTRTPPPDRERRPPEAIEVLPGVVSGTDDEARAVAAEIDRRPLRTLVIVTSPYHTRRALRTFDKILAGRKVDIGIEHPGVGEISPNPNSWWLTPRGWQMVAMEHVKSAVYYAIIKR